MAERTQHPILLLREIEQRSKAHAFTLPQQTQIETTWDGVGFRIGEQVLTAPLDQVKEILTSARWTRVPGAKPWVKGVANVRGMLLPIMDLNGFLTGASSVFGRRSRILVIRNDGVDVGLIVDEVLGLQHFPADSAEVAPKPPADYLAPYLNGAFVHQGNRWPVFEMHRLLESPEFKQVAA